MRGAVLLTLAALGAASAGSAADFTAPPRRAGLWKQTISSSKAGQAQPPMSSTICMDAAVDKAMSVFGAGAGRQACASNTITKTATGYRFASVCQMGPSGTISSQGVASGDFSKAYKVSMTSNTTGAAMAQMNGASATEISAVWAGPCPADQKPGDMVLPGGMKMNMLSLMAAAPKR